QERGGIEEMPEPKDKVQALKDQVDGVKSIMTQNVDRILARGERLDDLMGKTEDLQAGKVESSYRCKNIQLIVAIIVIVLIAVLIIIILLAAGHP
uniref:Vesicle-associated membrane protein 7 n=1 Tax=Pundamilia nyererei TaxID=303518 RepID=A0A3B4FF92_9CICH